MPKVEREAQEFTSSTLLFVGDMSRKLNVEGITWFLDKMWPSILEKHPGSRLNIVGRNPPPNLVARSDKMHTFVTGFVDDLLPWYQKATVFISPLLVAGGLLQKVLDAMWLGIPVVATSVCNHGLGAESDVEIITSDTDTSFVDAVVSLLQNPFEAKQLGLRGQAFVKEHYDIEPALDRWAQALRESE
jgi:glycosyltransferase involved in cell wall biosynthesis